MPPARPTYRVDLVAPVDARDELLRLWADNLHLEGTAAAKFDWLYRAAPHRAETVFLLRAVTPAADGGERIETVGTAGVGVRRFQLAATPAPGACDVSAGLLADLAVDRAHRSVGPALALVRQVKAHALAHHQLAYGFPNALAEGVFKRVGYHTLGKITRWALVLRHAGYAARVRELELARVPAPGRELLYRLAAQPAVATVGGAALDLALLTRRAPAALVAARRVRVEASSAPPPAAALDLLWARARGEHEVLGHRTAAVLAWRYPAAPARTWYVAHGRAGHGLGAYAVVDRAGDGSAHVRDLFGHRADMLALLELLPPLVYRTGATSLSMRYLGAPWLAEALAARGFSPRQADRTIMVGTADALDPGLAQRVRDPDAWHLTDLDEDT